MHTARTRTFVRLSLACLAIGLMATSQAFAQTVTISDRYVEPTAGPWASTAVYVLTAAGDIVASSPVGNTTSDVGDWLTPKSGMSSYEVRATQSTPACNGPSGTWQSLSS